MSDPLLSPRPLPAVHRPGPPLAELAHADLRGVATADVMLLIAAGWLFASPAILDYADHLLALNDRIAAVLVAALALASMLVRRPYVGWIAGAIGLWLIAAPVLWWAPTAGAYLSTTLTGTLIAMEGLVLPMTRPLPGPETPQGWSYNPSAWSQRVPVILLAAGSFVVAAYLGAYQLGYVDRIWDPVFGLGTERVLDSAVSRAWPVSDAALGAAMYLIDMLMACAGGTRRWRTMPWLVILFGILIIPIGVVSITLVILQPVAVGAWCGWCLLTAIATVIMIPLAIDEVGATLALLRGVRREGGSWWSVFWRGAHGGGSETIAEPRHARALPPWNLWVLAGAGVWMMIAPAVFGTTSAAADSAYLTGALLIVVAVTAMSEVARPLRLLAIPLVAWSALAPWVLPGAPPAARLAALLVAGLVIVTSLPRGKIGERRAGLDRLAMWPA